MPNPDEQLEYRSFKFRYDPIECIWVAEHRGTRCQGKTIEAVKHEIDVYWKDHKIQDHSYGDVLKCRLTNRLP